MHIVSITSCDLFFFSLIREFNCLKLQKRSQPKLFYDDITGSDELSICRTCSIQMMTKNFGGQQQEKKKRFYDNDHDAIQ